MEKLTYEECSFILTSLDYTRDKFENYNYPTYELRKERLKEVHDIMHKIQRMRKEVKHENRT